MMLELIINTMFLITDLGIVLMEIDNLDLTIDGKTGISIFPRSCVSFVGFGFVVRQFFEHPPTTLNPTDLTI